MTLTEFSVQPLIKVYTYKTHSKANFIMILLFAVHEIISEGTKFFSVIRTSFVTNVILIAIFQPFQENYGGKNLLFHWVQLRI